MLMLCSSLGLYSLGWSSRTRSLDRKITQTWVGIPNLRTFSISELAALPGRKCCLVLGMGMARWA
jgi:hypothetical protein